MKVFALRCPKCGDIIYSRAQHDFHYCSCKYMFIDGGFEYSRFGAESLDNIDQLEIDVKATKEDLYKDWNKNTNKFGVIKKDEPCAVISIIKLGKDTLKSNGQKSKNSKQKK